MFSFPVITSHHLPWSGINHSIQLKTAHLTDHSVYATDGHKTVLLAQILFCMKHHVPDYDIVLPDTTFQRLYIYLAQMSNSAKKLTEM
jgi:hypothetical protein